MLSFTAFIQYCIGGVSSCNIAIKRNKTHRERRGRIIISLLTNIMIVYVENPMQSTKRQKGIINELSTLKFIKSI